MCKPQNLTSRVIPNRNCKHYRTLYCLCGGIKRKLFVLYVRDGDNSWQTIFKSHTAIKQLVLMPQLSKTPEIFKSPTMPRNIEHYAFKCRATFFYDLREKLRYFVLTKKIYNIKPKDVIKVPYVRKRFEVKCTYFIY